MNDLIRLTDLGLSDSFWVVYGAGLDIRLEPISMWKKHDGNDLMLPEDDHYLYVDRTYRTKTCRFFPSKVAAQTYVTEAVSALFAKGVRSKYILDLAKDVGMVIPANVIREYNDSVLAYARQYIAEECERLAGEASEILEDAFKDYIATSEPDVEEEWFATMVKWIHTEKYCSMDSWVAVVYDYSGIDSMLGSILLNSYDDRAAELMEIISEFLEWEASNGT